MWLIVRLSLIAGAFACLAVRAALSAPIAAGPQASAGEIRVLRAAAQGEVRRLVFGHTGGHEAPGDLTVELGADYVRTISAGQDIVHDFKLRRTLVLRQADRRFANTSFFGDLGFRTAEFSNRMMLAKVLTGAGLESGKVPMSVVDIQSQIGLTLPNVPLAAFDVSKDDNGVVRLTHSGTEMGRIRFGEQRLSPGEKQAFSRFLRRGLIMHPAIANAIAADGRVPAEITFLEYRGFEKKPRTLTLKSSESAIADYPLPASFGIETQPIGGASAKSSDLFQIMIDAVNRRAGVSRSVSAYRSEIESAHKQGRPMQVALSTLELSLHHGASALLCQAGSPPDCRPLNDMLKAANADPQVQTLMTGLSYEGRDAPKGVPYLRKVERGGLRNAYLIDVFLANDLGNSAEAPPLFANAVRGNPFVAPFYKDYGDYWFRVYDGPTAWLFYDLGRSLPDAGKTPNLERVDVIERKLAQDFPEFF